MNIEEWNMRMPSISHFTLQVAVVAYICGVITYFFILSHSAAGHVRIQRAVPECLNRRYRALDELMHDLSSMVSNSRSSVDCKAKQSSSDVGIKLMCQFWDILKEDPDCNLPEVVQQRMAVHKNTGFFKPQHVMCYNVADDEQPDPNSSRNENGNQNPNKEKKQEAVEKIQNLCCSGKSVEESIQSPSRDTDMSTTAGATPLSQALCNMKEAASYDQKCNAKIMDLLEAQKILKDQIQNLEEKEKEGIQMLKQADCLWSCMEQGYKKNLAVLAEKQKNLMNQMREIETSNAKWRKSRKDLELQVNTIRKCQIQIMERTMQKQSDLKCMDNDIKGYTKKIENNKKEIEAIQKSMDTKKEASIKKINLMNSDIKELAKRLAEERKHKENKEQDGAKYVKEARDDLQNICRYLLQKKLENENILAERDAILKEIQFLNKTCDECKDKCKNKEQTIYDEIKKVNKEIAGFKVMCIRCHQCEDTSDLRKFCVDCPKCLEERNCLLEVDHCIPDHTMDCVCVNVKQRFLDNVLDNMYTVLDKQAKTRQGKIVAEAILNDLKRSKNGKLTDESRNVLQDFILTSIKKNLNLTIVGGAVKTRCEMDSDTYNQLMSCLKQVKAVAPPTADKGTIAKKEPCSHWGGTSECNCPRGPKYCACSRRAPPPLHSSTPLPPPEKDDDADKKPPKICPHKEDTICGPDCGNENASDLVAKEIAGLQYKSCEGPSCSFSKNMRAAQCILGPETLTSAKYKATKPTKLPKISVTDEMCKCGSSLMKICKSRKDTQLLASEKHNSERKSVFSDVSQQTPLSSSLLRETKNNKRIKRNSNVMLNDSTSKERDLKQKMIISNKIDTVANKLKVTIQVDKNKSYNQFTEISNTGGVLSMVLDKKILNEIEKRSKKNPELNLSLEKSCSGHYTINISPQNHELSNSQKVYVRKTPSGSTILQLQKKLIDTVKPSGNFVKINQNTFDNFKSKATSANTDNFKKEIASEKKDTGVNPDVLEKKEFAVAAYISTAEATVDNSGEVLPNFSKIKIRGLNQKVMELPAVLKLTSSQNYMIILDKEFEKQLKETVSKYVGSESQCSVILSKSSSGGYIIDFNDDSLLKPHDRNALLKVSETESVRILVNGPEFKFLETELKNRDSLTSLEAKKSARAFVELISKFQPEVNVQSSEKFATKPDPVKSNSDSQLYNNIKVRLEDHKILLAEPSAILKKTSSEKYAIILNKDSKKSFVNNLKKLLNDNCQGIIPVRKTDSGKILISFNSGNVRENEKGFLKISPSGNIFIIVDEDVINKVASENSKKETTGTHTLNTTSRSSHLIGKVLNPEHKGVSTSCKGIKGSFCNMAECICKRLINDDLDIPSKIKCTTLLSSNRTDFDWNTREERNLCRQNVSKRDKKFNYFKDESPTRGLKPKKTASSLQSKSRSSTEFCGCQPILNRPNVKEQCFFLFESVCNNHNNDSKIYHSSDSKSVSNSDVDSEEKTKTENDKIRTSSQNWDALDYLPPQLPSFLRNKLHCDSPPNLI